MIKTKHQVIPQFSTDTVLLLAKFACKMCVKRTLIHTSSGWQGSSVRSSFLMPSITFSRRASLNCFSLSQRVWLNRRSRFVLQIKATRGKITKAVPGKQHWKHVFHSLYLEADIGCDLLITLLIMLKLMVMWFGGYLMENTTTNSHGLKEVITHSFFTEFPLKHSIFSLKSSHNCAIKILINLIVRMTQLTFAESCCTYFLVLTYGMLQGSFCSFKPAIILKSLVWV